MQTIPTVTHDGCGAHEKTHVADSEPHHKMFDHNTMPPETCELAHMCHRPHAKPRPRPCVIRHGSSATTAYANNCWRVLVVAACKHRSIRFNQFLQLLKQEGNSSLDVCHGKPMQHSGSTVLQGPAMQAFGIPIQMLGGSETSLIDLTTWQCPCLHHLQKARKAMTAPERPPPWCQWQV